MAARIFILINILYFIWIHFGVPYIPDVLIGGWMPSQFLAYVTMPFITVIIWAIYFYKLCKWFD